jgi:pimeloyl-ACP methyl ester carboxylesterase
MIRRTLVGGLAGLLAAGLAVAPLTLSAEAAPAAAPALAPAAQAAPAALPPVPTPPALSWGKCDDERLREAKAQCTMLTVPLDYANPSAGTIKLAVSRVLATKKPYRGALFTNPGGPGGAGLQLARYAPLVPKKAGLNYDWYGVDPRGVGDSEPALSCDPSFAGWNRKPYVPKTQAITDYWVNKVQNYVTACANSPAKALLPHMKTTDNVQDFESLRLAIGQSQVTWFGFSYGTYIGQVYATLYPNSLKQMVLDGVVDPSRVWYPANFDQDYAFDKTINRFFAWVAKYDDVYGLGNTKKKVQKQYFRTEKKLTKKPAWKKRLGPAEFNDVIVQAGYYNVTWLDVASGWSKLVKKGNGRPLGQFYGYDPKDPQADNGFAVYLATQCSDAPWPTTLSQWLGDANAVAQGAKYLTWNNTWFNLGCRTWPVAPSTPTQVTGTFTGPVLLTSETYDAATPISGARAVRAIFPNSALVEGKGGTTHAASFYGVKCIDNSIADLLKKGKLPARKAGNRSDLRCKGLQPPDPTASTDESGRVAAPLRLLFDLR